MDFYYALTLYHVICVVLHKLKKNNRKSVIMISNLTVNYKQLKTNLERSGLFKEVYLLNHRVPSKSRMNMAELENDQYLESIIDQYVSLFEQDVPVDIAQFDNRYICADHFPIGIYLNVKNLDYYHFEDGNGQQSQVYMTLEGTIKKNDIPQYHIIKKLGLFGKNDNVINRYINFNAQDPGYAFEEKDVDFDVYSLIHQLSKKQKNQLKRIFEAPDLNFDSSEQRSVLFLPQHNVNLHVFTTEQQLYQSGLILDYFASGLKVYIKPHPNDIFTNYNDLGGDVHLIPHTFPAELLPLYTNQKFKKGITAWSTSIQSLEPIFSKTIRFTSEIDTDYPSMHRYYACCKMLGALSPKEPVAVYTLGVNEALFCYMLTDSGAFEDDPALINTVPLLPDDLSPIHDQKTCFIVVDDLTRLGFDQAASVREQLLQSNATGIIFINSKNDYFFFDGIDYEIFSKMIPWVIQKELLFEPEINSEISIDEESVWLYMNDKNGRDVVSNLHYIKQLPYSKMVTRVNMADDHYQLPSKHVVYRNIKMLEGILKATEQRVLLEMDRNKELIEQNKQLEEQVKQMEHTVKQYCPSDEWSSLENESKRMQEELRLYEKKIKNMELKKQLEELKSKYNSIAFNDIDSK